MDKIERIPLLTELKRHKDKYYGVQHEKLYISTKKIVPHFNRTVSFEWNISALFELEKYPELKFLKNGTTGKVIDIIDKLNNEVVKNDSSTV